MDLRDFSEIGQQIENTVKNAIDSMNFDQLNQNIHKTFDDAFGSSKGSPYDAQDDIKHRYHYDRNHNRQGHPFYYRPKNPYQQTNQQQADSRQTNRRQTKGYQYTPNRQTHTYERGEDHVYRQKAPSYEVGFPVMVNPPGRVSSVLMMVFGYIGLGVTGTALITSWAVSAAIGRLFSAGVAVTIVSLPVLTVCIILAAAGTKTHRKLTRFRSYLEVLKGRTFCSLKELASRIGKTKHFVFKDVRKMIDEGYFPEGHLDEQKTCLMVTDQIYDQYLAAQAGMKQREAKAADSDSEVNGTSDGLTPDEQQRFNKIISDGEMYMQHIRDANDAIPDTEISNKLYRMELIIRKIFDYVKAHPEQISQLRRFIDYYMPTTDKLVNAYKEFEAQPIQGENIKTAKEEISKALDTINDAYEKLYDSMYADAAMDVSSDISVLQTLLAQEGLTKDDFGHGRKK